MNRRHQAEVVALDPIAEARHSVVSAAQETARAAMMLSRHGLVLVSLGRAETMLATALEGIDQAAAKRDMERNPC